MCIRDRCSDTYYLIDKFLVRKRPVENIVFGRNMQKWWDDQGSWATGCVAISFRKGLPSCAFEVLWHQRFLLSPGAQVLMSSWALRVRDLEAEENVQSSDPHSRFWILDRDMRAPMAMKGMML